MKPATEVPTTPSYDALFAGRGLRMTEQRRSVYEALMAQKDHPSAVDVFMRVKERVPSISLATVYNCLETLTECGLIRHVHHDREPSRYCANLQDHAHLFCTGCGSVTDLPLRPSRRSEDVWEMPAGAVVAQREVAFRGLCPTCAERTAAATHPSPTSPDQATGSAPARKRHL